MIGETEDMQYLLKLHKSVQKVKASNEENSTKIVELSSLFKELGDTITRVQKAQSKAAGAASDKKKDDAKKAKK